MTDLSDHEMTRFDSNRHRRAERIPGHGREMLEQIDLHTHSRVTTPPNAARQRAEKFGALRSTG